MMTLQMTLRLTFEGHFRYYKRFHCLYLKMQHKYYVMYEVNYNGRTSYVINNFYCHIRPEDCYMMLSATC